MAKKETETIGGGGRMLSITEAAQELGVSGSTVSRLVTSGALGSVRSGKRAVRVPDAALTAFIDAGGIPTGGRARRHG
jgi:excisionase family DNA binding protein